MTLAIIHLLSATSFGFIASYVNAQSAVSRLLFWAVPGLLGITNAVLAWDYFKAFLP